ncbi:MAG TPA: ABC-2 transporter permease [Candidatus Binatus sp.]|nr:ABC-2 transporter permease [Candidatus Binatus sp.]
MNYAMVKRLVLKDWYLQRWAILGSLAGVVATLGIIATGGKVEFLIGLILLIMVIISIGAQMAVSTIVTERKEQTLPFVMSLPISYREYTASKIWGNLIIFLMPWLTMVLGSFGLLLWSPSRGLIPYAAIMSTEILLSTCLILAVALITESQGWTVAAIMVGNLAVNGLGYVFAHIGGIAKGMWGSTIQWSGAASAVLLAEFTTIVLLLGVTFFVQAKKKDFL